MSLQILAAVCVLLAACGHAPSMPPATVTTMPTEVTSMALVRPTLPPRWTLTSTATPAPPTATRTPTPTPSNTPTSSPEDICGTFWYVTNLPTLSGASTLVYLKQNGNIQLFTSTRSAGDSVHFVATNRLTGKHNGTDIPGGTMLGVNFPVKVLPGLGLYDWSLSVQDPGYGELCKVSGTFIVISRESTRDEERRIR